jgi:hypothetical protein
MFLKLNQTLGSSYEADQDDVRGMKTALSEVGEYTPPRHGINGWTDDALFDGMKRFQKKRGLHVDGVARPGGPTETNLNSALAEGLRPINAPSKPTRRDGDNETRVAFGATPTKPDRQRSPLGVPPKRPKVFDVSAGVGQGQLNGRYDVRGAKHTLAWAGYYPKDKAQTADGRVDDDLTWGIWDFQRDHKLKRDGYMLPGGETATALNALVAPLVRAAFGGTDQNQPSTRVQDTQVSEEPPRAQSDADDGDGQDAPDTNVDRVCAELQRQRDAWEADIQRWMDDKLFLNNNDISQLSGDRRTRYLALIREYTGFAKRPDEDLKSADNSSANRNTIARKDGDGTDKPKKSQLDKVLEALDMIGTVIGPMVEEMNQHTRDKAWEAEVRMESNYAIVEIEARIDQAKRNLDLIMEEVRKERLFLQFTAWTNLVGSTGRISAHEFVAEVHVAVALVVGLRDMPHVTPSSLAISHLVGKAPLDLLHRVFHVVTELFQSQHQGYKFTRRASFALKIHDLPLDGDLNRVQMTARGRVSHIDFRHPGLANTRDRIVEFQSVLARQTASFDLAVNEAQQVVAIHLVWHAQEGLVKRV